MRRALEFSMYLAFSAAAPPPAWLGLSALSYYRAHPEMLEVRDAALEVGAVLVAMAVAGIVLLIAIGLAIYIARVGTLGARINIIVIVTAWGAAFFIPDTAFRSFARLNWEALPFAALVLVPWFCAAVRFAFRTKRSTPAQNAPPGELPA